MTSIHQSNPSSETAVNETRNASPAPVDRLVGWPIALAAAAGGLIHLKASVDHRHLAVVAIGFVIMGASQWLFAGTMFVRPDRPSLAWGGAFHAGILLVWILSRTIGLPFIPGAEQPVPVGVADLVANTFSLAVAGTAIVALVIDRSVYASGVRPRVVRTIKAVVLAGVLILTVVALTDVHDHDHDQAAASPPATSHDDSSPSTPTTHTHDDHPHTEP